MLSSQNDFSFEAFHDDVMDKSVQNITATRMEGVTDRPKIHSHTSSIFD